MHTGASLSTKMFVDFALNQSTKETKTKPEKKIHRYLSILFRPCSHCSALILFCSLNEKKSVRLLKCIRRTFIIDVTMQK